MKGFPKDHTPKNPDIFLLVRIELENWNRLAEFERNGVTLVDTFEDQTKLQLIVGGKSERDQLVYNFWRFRAQEPRNANQEEPAIGGVRDLLPAMGRVNDIAEYGPVDDLVRLESQDLVGEFSTTGRLGDPELPAFELNPDQKLYYVLFEYDIGSGESGTLAFKLRAYLVDLEIETGWRCVYTCFPMTGKLTRYVQIFAFASSNEGAALDAEVAEFEEGIRWERPVRSTLLEPTLYSPALAALEEASDDPDGPNGGEDSGGKIASVRQLYTADLRSKVGT